MKRLFCLLALVASPALAQVGIDQPWIRATPPGAQVAGGFMTITNKGSAADRLVGATSPVAERVELHVSRHEGGMMKMKQVQGFDVPANGQFVLKPGGGHMMFVNIKRPIKQGEKIPVTLKFENAGEVKAEYAVVGVGAMGAGGGAQQHDMKH